MWLAATAVVLSSGAAQAQQPGWQWLTQSSETRAAVMQRMTTDAAGNVYLAGRFTGQIRLGTTRLVSQGRSDAFVAKLTAGGQWVWAVAAGGTGYDDATDLTLDATGNLLVTGSFMGSIQFGERTATSQGGTDVFVAALTPEGEWRGILTAGGPGEDEGLAITTDRQHNVLVGGRFQGAANFGTQHLSTAAGSDGFVAQLNAAGSWNWAAAIGSNDQAAVRRLAVDGQGCVVATGYFGGTGQFGGRPVVSTGVHNAFVAKLTGSGAWQWVATGHSESTTYGNALAIDEQNHIFVTGSCSGLTDFGPYQLASQGGDDAYVARLSPTGTWNWVTSLRGSALETGKDLALGSRGALYLVGSSSATATCPGSTLPNQGGLDVFMAQLTTEGRWLNVQSLGHAGPDEATALTLTPTGEAFVGGTLSLPEPASAVAPQLFVGRLRFPASTIGNR